jgi:hypothetical protein
VPPGTAGNEDVCPCYAHMTTHNGRHKCPWRPRSIARSTIYRWRPTHGVAIPPMNWSC